MHRLGDSRSNWDCFNVVFHVYIPQRLVTHVNLKILSRLTVLTVTNLPTLNQAGFERMKVHSRTRKTVLDTLKDKPKTWSEIWIQVKHVIGSKSTVSNALKELEREGLISPKSKRNAPYVITKKGQKWLKMGQRRPVEDFVIEVIREGPFIGSIIIRLPEGFGTRFLENGLYTPRPLESLRRIVWVALEFWVTKHSQSSKFVISRAHGRDFNNDGVADLVMYENPVCYPAIRKALKEHMLGAPLIECAYEALEEKLAKKHIGEKTVSRLYPMLQDPRGRDMLKLVLGLYEGMKRGGAPDMIMSQLIGGGPLPRNLKRFLKNVSKPRRKNRKR